MSNIDKYLKISRWAQRRYTKNGILILDTGGHPSKYSRIEEAAFNKYMRRPRDKNGNLIF